ncbi:hypothetical protein SynBIOSU31_02029 [Synechococcus sp. BIOS-U3-1]|nr:hypothetical protein SynBIOSU31_02029 [Synechococcus sp. BIOS-U3-1]|tara:strand:+ start:718 stop:843 length:126 start_codon:yes stop_codon:yes gene_type:complete
MGKSNGADHRLLRPQSDTEQHQGSMFKLNVMFFASTTQRLI